MEIVEQIKHGLGKELCAIPDGWTLSEACVRMGVDPAGISRIRNGKLAGFSIGRLIRMIAMHGYDVEFVLRPMQRPRVTMQRPAATVVSCDQLGRPIPRRCCESFYRGL